jgi:hypothetical protein
VVDGYLVQKYWSNKDGTSIAPGGTDYQDLKQVPADLSVAHFTLTSLQQGAKTAAEFQIVALTSPIRTLLGASCDVRAVPPATAGSTGRRWVMHRLTG